MFVLQVHNVVCRHSTVARGIFGIYIIKSRTWVLISPADDYVARNYVGFVASAKLSRSTNILKC